MLSWSLPVTSTLYRQLLLPGRILVNLIIAIVWRDAACSARCRQHRTLFLAAVLHPRSCNSSNTLACPKEAAHKNGVLSSYKHQSQRRKEQTIEADHITSSRISISVPSSSRNEHLLVLPLEEEQWRELQTS